MKYLKLIISIILFEVIVWKIGYEFGYNRGSAPIGIFGMFLFALYFLIYLIICIYQMWNEPGFGMKIFTFIYMFGMFLFFLVETLIASKTQRQPTFVFVYLVLIGIAFVVESAAFIFGIKEKIAENRIKKQRRKAV